MDFSRNNLILHPLGLLLDPTELISRTFTITKCTKEYYILLHVSGYVDQHQGQQNTRENMHEKNQNVQQVL